jgi:hypothetical protein
VNLKKQRAHEQPTATTANVAEFHLGGAPTMTYGRSAAVLRDRIKRRATYTPFDALEVMKKRAERHYIDARLDEIDDALTGDAAHITAAEAEALLAEKAELETKRRSKPLFAGPELVATHENLAAVVRFADTAALREIVKKAENPNVQFDRAIENYIEAQIHGPIVLSDIERITIALDDLDLDAYEQLLTASGGEHPSEQAIQARVEQLKLTIRQSLETHGVPVEFRWFDQP